VNMSSREIDRCECGECQGGNEVIGKQHEELNLLMSRLDEQQRRWVVALEAKKIGHGGSKKLSETSQHGRVTKPYEHQTITQTAAIFTHSQLEISRKHPASSARPTIPLHSASQTNFH